MNSAAKKADPVRLPERRSFLTRAVTVLMGGIVVIFPFAAGLGVLFDPLRRRNLRRVPTGPTQSPSSASARSTPCPPTARHACSPSSPTSSTPGRARPAQRIGSVFLMRTDADGKPTVTCFTSTCPHLGCAVDWHSSDDHYECPCHVSAFDTLVPAVWLQEMPTGSGPAPPTRFVRPRRFGPHWKSDSPSKGASAG